jgi:hypothetical protein
MRSAPSEARDAVAGLGPGAVRAAAAGSGPVGEAVVGPRGRAGFAAALGLPARRLQARAASERAGLYMLCTALTF